jgi:hypothetical protein
MTFVRHFCSPRRLPVWLVLLFFAWPGGVGAQEPGLKLAVGDVGLGIGDVPRLDGLRLNFRDRHLELIRGVNVTVWSPHRDPEGVVQGMAVGLPVTGAAELTGVALAGGVAVDRDFTGIGIAPLGVATGGRLRGVAITGLGAASGGSAEGILLGGLGVGAGGQVRGIAIGGLGVGAGGRFEGLGVGGLGVGAGGSVRGVTVGGLGVGAGGRIEGITIGGLGVGAGGSIRGLTIGGVGIGAGGALEGLSVAGLGLGAPQIQGVAVSGLAMGAADATGLMIAPAYLRIEEEGVLRGVSISAFNDIRGEQRGLAIGILNIANELHGLQLGLINIARNKERFPVLPIANYHP